MPALRHHARRPLTATAAISNDKEAAGLVVRAFQKTSLRESPLSTLNQAVTDLYRAGVRVDMRSSMPGKALMGQLQTELARRAALSLQHLSRATVRQVVAPGAYSAAVQAVSRAYKPKQYSTYA